MQPFSVTRISHINSPAAAANAAGLIQASSDRRDQLIASAKRKDRKCMRIHFLSDGESRWESNPPKQAAAYTGFEDQRAHQSPFCSHVENPRLAVYYNLVQSKSQQAFQGVKRICILFRCQGSGRPGAKKLPAPDPAAAGSGIPWAQDGFRTRTRLSPTILVIFWASK